MATGFLQLKKSPVPIRTGLFNQFDHLPTAVVVLAFNVFRFF